MPQPCSALRGLRLAMPGLVILVLAGWVGTSIAQSTQSIPEPAELEKSGAVIGEIRIDAQNIFDTNDPKEDKSVFRIANSLHIKTRDGVIRNQLLFRTGSPFSQRALEESERILRSDRYLYDASVRPIAYHDGQVDIAVTTRDVWTLNPGISFGRHGGKNTFGFELEELNLLGTGTAISASHKSGIDRDTNTLEYRDTHLGGSWVTLNAQYSNNSDGSTRGLSLDRPFYSLDTPYAGGTAWLDNDRVDTLYDRGEIIDQYRAHTRFANAYGGWSRGLVDGWVKRWTAGVTYDDEQFDADPNWAGTSQAPTSLVPEDRHLVYPWIGFDLVQNDYLKLHNHDQIDRTEDFYLGARLSAKLGWADTSFGSDRDALMFFGSGGYGMAASDRSTLLFIASTSGRVESGELRNALLNGAIRYYVKQSERRLFFATLDATTGKNLDLDNQILLGGDNGLRGYPLRYQAGTSRALLTVEQRYFTDWYPFRLFRIGGAAFFDIGRTWGTSPLAEPSMGALKDVGIGLRIGNTRSGLGNIIHVDLAFPLDGDSSISNVQLLVETKQHF